ncbi:restriction endonuclease [Halalkalicoccus salilacus]|uniref:restriction endonuclease n=1 Tax=Halalkalicoccus TaxID=332246 RepID=UPI002F968A8C
MSERNDSRREIDQLRRRLQSIDDFDFEHLIADLWKEQGWDAKVEQQSGDAGIDVRATKSQPYPRKVLIQAKRYNNDNPIGGPDIQQYSALKYQESDVDEVIIVTTGRFTTSAQERARNLNVKTIDGEDLINIIKNLDAYGLIDEYAEPLRGNRTHSAISDTNSGSDQVNRLDPKSRQAIEDLVGQNADDFFKDKHYKSIRAFEKAEGLVKLNPHDAKMIGVFDNLITEEQESDVNSLINGLFADEFEKIFPNESWKLIFLKEDIFIDDEENVFVEDLTDYVPYPVIRGEKQGPIIGQIERGVQDGEWMSENGEILLEGKEYIDSITDRIKDFSNSLSDKNQRNKHVANNSSNETTTVENDSPTKAITAEIEPDESIWYYGTIAGTLGWLLVWVVIISTPTQPAITAIVLLASWLVLPVALLMDSRHSGFFATSKIELAVYLLLSLVPLVALIPGAAYLYRRNSSSSG